MQTAAPSIMSPAAQEHQATLSAQLVIPHPAPRYRRAGLSTSPHSFALQGSPHSHQHLRSLPQNVSNAQLAAAAAAAGNLAQLPFGAPPPRTAALLTAENSKGKVSGRLSNLHDDCLLRVFSFLEAPELAGCAAQVSRGTLALATDPRLWAALLYLDFSISLSQRLSLGSWIDLHEDFHPRQLYVFKHQEQTMSLEAAQNELQQRLDYTREQEKNQRRLKNINLIQVRVLHLLCCVAAWGSTLLFWLKTRGTLDVNYHVVMLPVMIFCVFLVACLFTVLKIYRMRNTAGVSFYWHRLRGCVRWLVLYTSAAEATIVIGLATLLVPISSLTLEKQLPKAMVDHPQTRYLAPFAVVWMAWLVALISAIRRKVFSLGCISSFLMLWLPGMAFTILLYLKLTVCKDLSLYAVAAPTVIPSSLLLIFVSFLVVASLWLGYRGNRDWTEYAAYTLVTLFTVLLPGLLLQIGIALHNMGKLSTDGLFIPMVLWLTVLSALGTLQVVVACRQPFALEALNVNAWRNMVDSGHNSDTELLISPSNGVV